MPSQAEITYTSGDPSVVTVDENGNLAGVGSGITYVLVKSGVLTCSVPVNVCEAIASAAEFREKLIADPEGTFLITQDLDFSAEPFRAVPSFSGTLFGGGHKLRNMALANHMTADGSTSYGGALFENLSGTVRDLYIDASYEVMTIVVKEGDAAAQQLGIQQYGGTVANLLYGTVENVYIDVDYSVYPWWGTNWNEAGAVCGGCTATRSSATASWNTSARRNRARSAAERRISIRSTA